MIVLSARTGGWHIAPMTVEPASKPHRVLLLAYEGVELLDIVGPLETFAAVNDASKRPRYSVAVAAARPGLVRASSGLAIEATVGLDAMATADTLLVAGGAGLEAALAQPALVEALRAAAPRVKRLGGVCTGAFLLAEAGLLDGRRAATHWEFCGRLAARYPMVKVERDPIFIADGDVWTSAGVTAGIDMALAMIERDCGPQAALTVAQGLVMFRRRPGGQSQFSVDITAQATENRNMRRLQEWIVDHPEADLSVEALAERVAMSPRNFSRAFGAKTGSTPARFVERARLQRARMLLETTAQTVEAIAAHCGFGSADVMTRVMQRAIGVGPTDYRKRFGAIWSGPGLEGETHARQ
jgi:transcriptional regulator GlxA family with amidase domain